MNFLSWTFRQFVCILLVFGFAATASAREIDLHVAVEQGLVSVRFEFLGGAMGDRMKIFLRKRIAGELQLNVVPGTVFTPRGADVQRLAAVKLRGELTARGTYQRAALINLRDASERGYLIAVVCIDYHKNSPAPGQAFLISDVDVRCQRMFSIRGNNDLSLWAYQSAVWMDRAGVKPAKLQATFNVATADIQAAQNLLKQAERTGAESLQQVEVSAEAKIAAQGMFSADPAIRAEAHAAVQSLDESDRLKLESLLSSNVFRGGKLPTAEELRAGFDLASLIPEGIEIPKLEIPKTVDDVIAIVEALKQSPSDANLGAGVERLRLLPHLTGLKARLPLFRITAARAIAIVKDPIAVEALIATLNDNDARVRSAAASGLQKLTGQAFGENIDQWEQWWQENHDKFLTATH